MEMQESDSEKLMSNLTPYDFVDPANTSECLLSSTENDCVLLETNDISSTSIRQSSDLNRDEERRENMNDMENRKSDESLPITVLNVLENQDCSLSKAETEIAPAGVLYEESNRSQLQDLSSNWSMESQVGTEEAPKKRRLESKKDLNDADTDNVDEIEIMTASLIQEKYPSYYTAVVTPPAKIHILPVPETNPQSMISESLVKDTPKQKSTKSKGPPPPVPKKPKNPFGKDAAHATDRPRPYSDLLQQNIIMGRRESALQYTPEDFDKSPPDLDMLSCCQVTFDSPSYMFITGGFDPGFQPEVEVPTIYSDVDGEDMDLWTKIVGIHPDPEELEISQLRHILEKKAKMKGPPPPVPKKALDPFVSSERDDVLPITVSIPKDTAGILTYESDYRPDMHRTVHEENPKTIFSTDTDNFIATYSNSNNLDENIFFNLRPETDKMNKKKTEQSSRDNFGNQGNKVLEMTRTSEVKKPFSCQMKTEPSPKKVEISRNIPTGGFGQEPD